MTHRSLHSGMEVVEYNSSTSEYQKWNLLEGEEWQAELDALARQGITLSYDHIDDVFITEEIIFV